MYSHLIQTKDERMIGQKEAVVNTLLLILNERGVEYVVNGEINIGDVLKKEDKDKANVILSAGFNAGEISLTADAQAKYVGDAKAMKKYVGGLINNWIRKNPDFNNGCKYIPKNPGSRTGQSDETIKNLRLMKKAIVDVKTLAEIDEAIADRLKEIKPELNVEINIDVIPEHLKHLIGKKVDIDKTIDEE